MLVNMKKMLNEAKENNYAVPQFNINNLEWTRFILEECNKNNSPVILGVSEGAARYMGGYKTVCNIVKDLISYLEIKIPVALHLDHGSSFIECKNAIDAGFTSVMIDASKYYLNENIEITKEVVEYAKKYDVTVEAEVGHIGGTEDDITSSIGYAKVDDCISLVKETNIDFLAPALGSVHGLYKGEPKLDFDKMKIIKEKVNLPLVLHGGTGISDELIIKSIDSGICKININTELQIAWSIAVRKFLNNDAKTYDPRKIIKAGEESIKLCVKNKIELLKSNSDKYTL